MYYIYLGGEKVAVSYKKLFKLLIDKDMTKGDLKAKTGLSYSTIAKLNAGENVNVSVLENICSQLECDIVDIVEFIPDKMSTNVK